MKPEVTLRILLVDDDEENLGLLRDTLKDEEKLGDFDIEWVTEASFDEARRRLVTERFDLVASDVYRDPPGGGEKGLGGPTDDGVRELVDWIRKHGFCPVLIFSSGTLPEFPPESAFLRKCDKSQHEQLVDSLRALLDTGVPEIAARMHKDLDHYAGGAYLWEFLEREWDSLSEELPREALERVVRRRAALVLGRLDSPMVDATDAGTVEGGEYYIYPALSGSSLRFGAIVREKDSETLWVVLTPHCDLVVQENADKPRAETVLLAGTVAAGSVLVGSDKATKSKSLKSKIGNPSKVGKPEGRYWFLPKFLSIPNLYCDFMALKSVEYEGLQETYDPVAFLDPPFAEAMQTAFTGFYGRIGTPELDVGRFNELITKADAGKKEGK